MFVALKVSLSRFVSFLITISHAPHMYRLRNLLIFLKIPFVA